MTMYAVVSSGGKQYRVEAGSLLTLEKLDGEPGASISFDRVLLIGDGDEVTVGTPVVPGASVSATVIGEALGPKLVIFKFKQKVKYRRRNGHRQHLTQVRIDTIHPTADRKATAKRAATEAKADEEPVAKAAAAPRAARPRAARAAAPKAAGVKKEAAEAKPKPRRTAKPKAKE
ncbi:MAG: 50S ribosomal protein L21 [Chloroflexota bacterium]|nr:50S ribosomal protein L21 [Chloroflexota bacterium]